MSGQAEAIPVAPGRPDSWTLRPEPVNISGIDDISENRNWMSRGNEDLDDGGTCRSRTPSKTNNLHSEAKIEDICAGQLPDQKQTQSSISGVDGAAADASAKKRRHASMSHPGNHKQVGRKRRKTTDRNATHPKFLMGGSITDPLNLNSLCNEEVSRCLNATTPISSPLPRVNKDPDPVIVPIDVRDPLKLNTVCSEMDETASLTRTLTPKSAGKKRKKRVADKLNESHSADEATFATCKPANLNLEGVGKPPHHASNSKIPDKIVSPVMPESGQSYRKRKKQEPTAKIARALLVEKVDPKPKETSPEKKAPPHNKDRGTPEKRKYKRQTSKEAKPQPPKFRDQNKKFQYGNYHRYYGYRNPDHEDDSRIPFLKRKWFEGKTCLDIGCNSGHVTLYVAKNFAPERITGIDIDGVLVGIARKNIRHCLEQERNPKQPKFPASMEKLYGPITSTAQPAKSSETTARFPGNILFRCANFVPENEDILELQKPEYDTVICLSVTKWIHLNWGDAGLKRMFRRIFLSLRPGGRLILEPQGWPSYTKKKKLTETIYKNFKQIQLKPDKFKDYLLSGRVGFSSCETIGTPLNKSKGFRRPILMFTKLTTSRASAAEPTAVVSTEQASPSTMAKEASAKPTLVAASSAVDPKPWAVPLPIPGQPSVEVCPEKERDPRPAVESVTSCPQPQRFPVGGDQAAHWDAGQDVKLEKSDGRTTQELSSEIKVENEVVKGDSDEKSRAKEVPDSDGNKEPEAPPTKKFKTESTD